MDPQNHDSKIKNRINHDKNRSGSDVHAFVNDGTENQFITLGGVQIPHTHSLLAHSDGDVVLHALCDALLGALALGDIGQFSQIPMSVFAI